MCKIADRPRDTSSVKAGISVAYFKYSNQLYPQNVGMLSYKTISID